MTNTPAQTKKVGVDVSHGNWVLDEAANNKPVNEYLAPPEISVMPRIFRLKSIRHVETGHRKVQCTALIFHECATIKVRWTVCHMDCRLKVGELVSPRWHGITECDTDGAIIISRLVLMGRPEPSENLFQTIPRGWVKNRALVCQAATLVEALPTSYRQLFNAIFWDGQRFKKFCIVPSSMKGHHMEDNGNLRHAVDVAKMMWQHSHARGNSDAALCILAGLLHDAGKAEEYVLHHSGEWRLSDRGKLLGHKITVIEWIASAMARNKIMLPEAHYMALLHCLTSSANAPDYLGIRRPAMIEAHLLSSMDRMSGTEDLMARHKGNGVGWGAYHAHLKGKPYMLGQELL